MASPAHLLVGSLVVLEKLHRAGQYVIATRDLAPTHRARLVDAGYLKPIIRGWYMTSRPEEAAGETTSWHAHWKEFVARYATWRFGDEWYLSPEISLYEQTAGPLASHQISVHAPRGNNNVISLPGDWSLLDYGASNPAPASEVIERNGLRMLSVPYALTQVAENFFKSQKQTAEIALNMLTDTSDLARALLNPPKPVVSARLLGALQALERDDQANELKKTMAAAGYQVAASNPFAQTPTSFDVRIRLSPYVMRMNAMWSAMREDAIRALDDPPGLPKSAAAYIADLDARYVSDAYNSLSIEGYSVTPELIERVRTGQWNPDGADQKSADAMAAKGYAVAHTKVKASIERILRGENAGDVLGTDLADWNRALWSPSVQAGLLKPEELAGYRNSQVYIRNAEHVPPPREAVRDCMPYFFDLLRSESHPAVRAVLGHFVFVFIHPYFDGNGRLARFTMNAMLASGGYPWTVIPVEARPKYFQALNDASSARSNIVPFAEFLGDLLRGNDGR